MIVAIDGPAGSGKSTTARAVAHELDYLYLDTGAMYRAVALAFVREGEERTEEGAHRILPSIRIDLRPSSDGLGVFLNDEDVSTEIRTPAVTAAASEVAALGPVRRKLVAEQRRIARTYVERGGGVVLDGRDIGTVVFPNADVKFFVVADERVRARRRYEELAENDPSVRYDDVLADIRRRDESDAQRSLAPLRKADDAVELDTTDLGIEEQVTVVIAAVKERQNLSTV